MRKKRDRKFKVRNVQGSKGIYKVLNSGCRFIGIHYSNSHGYQMVNAQFRPKHANRDMDKIEGMVTVWDRNRQRNVRIDTRKIIQIRANRCCYQVRH